MQSLSSKHVSLYFQFSSPSLSSVPIKDHCDIIAKNFIITVEHFKLIPNRYESFLDSYMKSFETVARSFQYRSKSGQFATIISRCSLHTTDNLELPMLSPPYALL